jgi:hypothetical protein
MIQIFLKLMGSACLLIFFVGKPTSWDTRITSTENLMTQDWSTPIWCPATQPGTRFRPSTPVHSRSVIQGYPDKKENQIFIKYKEIIQNGSVAKTNGLLRENLFCIYCKVDIWMIFLDSVHGPVLLSDSSHPREAPQGMQEKDGV